MKKLKAGAEVDSYCTKCKLDLNHRIIAMDGDKPKRVECLTCRGHHNYRRPKSETATAKPKKRSTSKRSAAARKTLAQKAAEELRASWEQAIMGAAPGDFTAYRISEVFAVGQLVRHKKFGDGVVSELMEDGKVQMLFEAGAKVLVHGR